MSTATMAPPDRSTQPSPKAPSRNARQEGLIDVTAASKAHVCVIGVGAVGFQVARLVAATGVKRLELVDHDTIEVVNLGPQGWDEADLHQLKTDAAVSRCLALNPQQSVIARSQAMSPDVVAAWGDDPVYVFMCVDDIEVRQQVFNMVRPRAAFVVDTRVGEQVVKVFSVVNPPNDTEYDKTLFARQETHVGRCTARMTMANAYIAAGLAVNQWHKHMKKEPIVPKFTFDLLSIDLFTD